jgi:hypothetical protein
MSAFWTKEGTTLYKKKELYEKLWFSFDDRWWVEVTPRIEINTIDELKELQDNVDDELIIDFNNMNIEIYNAYRE